MAIPRRKTPLVIAAVTGAVLAVPVRVGFPDCDRKSGHSLFKPRSVTLELVVAKQKGPLVKSLVEKFNERQPAVGDPCIRVDDPIEEDSGETAFALWRGEGKRPDVWMPSAKAWVELVRSAPKRKDVLAFHDVKSINKTPAVIAIPEPMARLLDSKKDAGWGRETITWQMIYELAQNPALWRELGGQGRFWLAKTNPTQSTSGLYSTLAAYFAATRQNILTAVDARNEEHQCFVRAVEESVLFYGATSVEVIPRLAGLGFDVAVPVQEVSVINYNLGTPTGQAGGEKEAPPETKLVALYPKDGTLWADQPFVILNKRKAAEAETLFDFLKTDSEKAFLAAGFRNLGDGQLSPEVLRSNPHLVADAPDIRAPRLKGDVIKAVLESWAELRKPARVLILTDLSTLDRVKSVQDAVNGHVLEMLDDKVLKDRDELGLWSSTSRPSVADEPAFAPAPAFPAMPWKRSDRNSRLYASLGKAMAVVGDPSQETPPVPGCVAGASTPSPDRVRRINSIILITDRQPGPIDRPPGGMAVDELIAQLRKAAHERGIRVFPIGFGSAGNCADEGLRQIADVSFTEFDCVDEDNAFGETFGKVIARIVPTAEPFSK
jgi:Ca-activated chloride channel family protein